MIDEELTSLCVRRTMHMTRLPFQRCRSVMCYVGHLPYAFFQSCTNSAFLQTFSLNAHSLCNPVLTIAYFPTEALLTSHKFLRVAVCRVSVSYSCNCSSTSIMYRSSRLNTKVHQQSHTTRSTGTCEAPGTCHAGTCDLCYLRRSYI